MAVIMRKPLRERAEIIEQSVAASRVLAGPGFAFDEARIRARAERTHDRCFYPQGTARQLAAILAMGRRTPSLKTITAPTLVLHGAQDPLFPPRFARAQAKAIPGARLEFIVSFP